MTLAFFASRARCARMALRSRQSSVRAYRAFAPVTLATRAALAHSCEPYACQ